MYAEKADLQSALLDFEQLFDHPSTPEEKELMKDIYDRYRTVKRLVRRSSNVSPNKSLILILYFCCNLLLCHSVYGGEEKFLCTGRDNFIIFLLALGIL